MSDPSNISSSAGYADALFRAAHVHHLAGRAPEAEAGYRAALTANPKHVDALHFLGVLALQFGHAQAAVQLIGQSVEITPTHASLNNLGEALRQVGRVDDAMQCLRQSLVLNPDHVDAMANFATILLQKGESNDAEQLLKRAAAISPNHLGVLAGLAMLFDQRAEAATSTARTTFNNQAMAAWERVTRIAPKHFRYQISFGNSLMRGDDIYRAASAYRRAIEIIPNDAESHAKLGTCLAATNKIDDALAEMQKAIDLAPTRWEPYRDRGRVLERAERTADARAMYTKAFEINPNAPLLLNDLGRMAIEENDPAAAIDFFNRAQAVDPGDARIALSRSKAFFHLERYEESLGAAREAARALPNEPDSHAALAFSLLATGNYEEGFAEYEWRWRSANFTTKPRNFEQPLWDGSDITGRSLLLHSEQGYGDVMQFLRYVPLLMARGIHPIVEVAYKLVGLVQRMSPALRVVPQGTILPAFDLHVPMLSLPAIFRTTQRHVPASVPYLRGDAALIAKWKKRLDEELADANALRVGVVWAGNPKPDRNRSMALNDFAPLARIPGISLISLQADQHADELKTPPEGLKLVNLGPELRDFSNTTASVLANLDLLITIDTSAAHLAGAMGVRTWLLLRYAPDWRWIGEARTSAWYPTMRLFRQSALGDWASVMREVVTELRTLSRTV